MPKMTLRKVWKLWMIVILKTWRMEDGGVTLEEKSDLEGGGEAKEE